MYFVVGSMATYFRLVPKIKNRYDYGVVVFMLTFNLVVVSGSRPGVKVWEVARERLLTILMGFIVCICVSLFVFPMWASDELHYSILSTFQDLANTIQGIFTIYFNYAFLLHIDKQLIIIFSSPCAPFRSTKRGTHYTQQRLSSRVED